MARRGENIYRRKDGRWEGRYVKGKRPNGTTWFGYVYGTRYSEVKKRLISLKSARQDEVSASCRMRKRLSAWLDIWLDEEVRRRVKRSTFEGYVRMVEQHIKPHLGGYYLHEITEEHLRSFSNQLDENLAAGTIRGIQRLLKAALKEAVSAGYIAESPFRRFRLHRIPHRMPRVLTVDEQHKLEQAALQDKILEPILALYTGLRLGELCALKWGDIDFSSQTLSVQRSVQRLTCADSAAKTALQIGMPKSASSVRQIPLSDHLIGLLREKRAENSQDEFVFPAKNGSAMDPRTLQNRFKSFAKSLGIEGAHVHTLRHTFAARCLEQQVGFEVLAQLLGHSSPRITMDHYAHATQDNMRRAISKLHPIGE